jgi:ABC-type glycerol-3-phosphate transport system substrate-binding protein
MLGQTAKDKSAPPETINMLYQDVENMFYTGKTAMMLHGSWLSAGIEKANPQLQGKVGLAPNPVYPRVGKRGTNAGGWGISITSKDQRKTQAAWDFLYLLTGRSDLRAKVIAEGGSIPVMRSIAGGWKPDIRTDWAKTIIDELPYAKTRPAVEIYPDASLEYAFSFQEVFLGKDAKRAVTDAEARVTKMSRDKGYLK